MFAFLGNPVVRTIGVAVLGGAIGYGTALIVNNDARVMKTKIDAAQTADDAAKVAIDAFNARKTAEAAKAAAKAAKAA